MDAENAKTKTKFKMILVALDGLYRAFKKSWEFQCGSKCRNFGTCSSCQKGIQINHNVQHDHHGAVILHPPIRDSLVYSPRKLFHHCATNNRKTLQEIRRVSLTQTSSQLVIFQGIHHEVGNYMPVGPTPAVGRFPFVSCSAIVLLLVVF